MNEKLKEAKLKVAKKSVSNRLNELPEKLSNTYKQYEENYKRQQEYLSRFNDEGYFDTGKKYGDYFYENYEQFKDMPIYEKNGDYYLYSNNSYQNVGKLDTLGNVIDTNIMTTNEIEDEKLKKAKELGFKGDQEWDKNLVTSKEYDEAQNAIEKFKKAYKLSDDEYNEFRKTGKLNLSHVSIVTNDMEKLKNNAVKYAEKIDNGEISKFTNKPLSISEQLYLDTSEMTDDQKENFINFLYGKAPKSTTEYYLNNKFFKESELWEDGWQPGDIIATMSGTLGTILTDIVGGAADRIEGLTDFGINAIGTLLEGGFGSSGKRNITKTINGNVVSRYDWGNQKFWYDEKNNKLYDDSGKEIKYFNIENLMAVKKFNNAIAQFGADWKNEVNTSNTMLNAITENDLAQLFRESGIAGEKTESLSQSLGSTLPLMFLGADAGTNAALTWTSTYGSSKAKNIQQGMSEEEARVHAFGDAVAETIAEQFFEGIPEMKTANWGKNFVKKLSLGAEKYFGTKAGQMVSKLLPVLGEGFEEIISNAIVAAENDFFDAFYPEYELAEGQTGNPLLDFAKEFVSRDSWDQFFSAVITSAILNGGSAIINANIKNDIIKSYAEDNNITFDEAKQELNLVYTGTNYEPATININKNGTVNFNGIEMTSNDLINKATRLIELSKTVEDEDSLNKLKDAVKQLGEAYDILNKQQEENKEIEKTEQIKQSKEIEKTEQIKQSKEIKKTEEPVKDTQQDREQLENTIQERNAKLEELKMNKSQNEEQIKKLEEELKTLRDEKNEQIKDVKLEKSINSQRRGIEQLEERIRNEKAQFGFIDESLNTQLETAKTRLQNLIKQSKQPQQNVDNTQRINEIKKQIKDLKAQDNTQEIEQLENQIKEDKKKTKKIFNRYQPDIKNMSDDFDYNKSSASHDTGFGISLTTSDKYIKGKSSSDVIQTTLQSNKGFLSNNDEIVNNQNIDALNKVMDKYMPDIPNVFTYGMSNSELIDAINVGSNLVANATDNQTGRNAWVEMYDAINKDGYIKEYNNGEIEASVVSVKNLENFEKTKNTIEEKIEEDKITVKPNEENIRSWSETATEGDYAGVDLVKEIRDTMDNTYIPQANLKNWNKINSNFNKIGYDEALKQFKGKIDSNQRLKLEDSMMGQKLLIEAANMKKTNDIMYLLDTLNTVSTETGQFIQALSIIKKLTPEGQLKMLQRTITRQQNKGVKTWENVKLTDEMINKVLDSENQEDLEKNISEVKDLISEQLTGTIIDKLRAWRYFAMLGNPRTHIRNMISNTAMYATRSLKKILQRTIEDTVGKINPNLMKERTISWKKTTDTVSKYVDDYIKNNPEKLAKDSKYKIESQIEQNKKAFGKTKTGKFTQDVMDFNTTLLENEDMIFKSLTFKSSLKEYLTANGIKTIQDIENNPTIFNNGVEYAVEQSLQTTFQQYSALAAAVNQVSNKNKYIGFGLEALLPFKRTPINITKTGIEYSPIGLLKTVTKNSYDLKKGNITANQYIDNISKGLTGSGLFYLGYILASMGILKGKSDDDDKESQFKTALNRQDYSINIGDLSVTIDWLTPVSVPLLLGVSTFDTKNKNSSLNMNTVTDMITNVANPIVELSFLQSFDTALDSYSQDKLKGVVETMLSSYIGQYFPTLGAQIAKTIDPTVRSTSPSKNSPFTFGEKVLRQTMSKIPGLSYLLEPSVDIYGNEVSRWENPLLRALDNLFDPASIKISKEDEVSKEIEKLYNRSKDSELIPTVYISKTVTFDGKDYASNAKEYTEMKKIYGQTLYNSLDKLIKTDTYKNADIDEKETMIRYTYTYAKDIMKKEYLAKKDIKYTNKTANKKDVYKDNAIKYVIENGMSFENAKKYASTHYDK